MTYSHANYLKNRKELIRKSRERYVSLSPKEKKKIQKKQTPYMIKWFMNKYHTDPVFRAKHIAAVIRCKLKKGNKTLNKS